jgi:hypothetical protein
MSALTPHQHAPAPTIATAPPTPKRGRPPVFDDAKRDHFLSLLRLGCTISKAAATVGLSRRGVLYAAKRDPQFAERIRLARFESRLDPINKIANSRSWHAAAWLLERNSREYRLPLKPSAPRATKNLLHRKPLRRRIRRMVEDVLSDVSQFAPSGK